MASITGIEVTLYVKTQTGTDAFNQAIYTETPVQVSNVLVYPTTNQENLELTNLYGKKAVYTLAIPKGDTHEWEDSKITFFGKDFRSFGIPQEGIENNIPLLWNKKVTVEVYE